MKRIRGKENKLQRELSIIEAKYAVSFFLLLLWSVLFCTLVPLNGDQLPILSVNSCTYLSKFLKM